MEYIAHFKLDNDKLLVQTVKEHTKNVCQFCIGNFNKFKVDAFMNLVATLHDVGKYSDDFQNYIRTAIRETQKGTYDSWITTADKKDHGVYGAYYIYSKYGTCKGIQKIVTDIMTVLICYHHGGLPDCILGPEYRCIPILERFKNNLNRDQYKIAMERFISENTAFDLEEMFRKATEEFESLFLQLQQFKKEKGFILNLIIKELYSILIDADRTDTCMFMMGEKVKSIPLNNVLESFIIKIENKSQEFKQSKASSELEQRVIDVRNQISEDCLKAAYRPVGVYTLTVPTGGGKTLSSLRFALNHAKLHHLKRIVYILPYTTIIEQNAKVVREVLNCSDTLLEYHSNVINDNKNEENELLSDRWDYPIIFTTMVQYLNTFYLKGTKDIRRLHNLSDSVIIFDEIQKLPIKCISLFNSSVNFLNKICHSTIILCSATQPCLFDTHIPILQSDHAEIVSNVSSCFQNLKRMNVVDKRIPGGYSYEKAGQFIRDLTQENNNVLVVTNTISSAEKVYDQVKEQVSNDFQLYLLSTHLCPAHRKVIIEEIKKKLSHKEKLICVSTQLIEAGVDISFDTVVRSLCGLDSIAQATGRANRHGEGDIKNSYIINLSDENTEKLTEISLGSTHCVEVLNQFNKDRNIFENELLSPKAIERYFDLYYSDSKISSQMDYPVENDEPIYEMLELQKKRNTVYSENNKQPIPISINYRFKSAGDHFRVIDNNTKTIIVPFGEGKKIIEKLLNDIPFKDKFILIKETQQYSVNVYENLFSKLKEENAFLPCPISGLYLLSEDFYDTVKGVNTDKKMKFENY